MADDEFKDYGFELGLCETGDEGSSFRTQNDPSDLFQRNNITERKGTIDIRCVAKDVIHGHMKDGAGFATLLVYEFQFDPRKRARRISSINMEFLYSSVGSKQPEVIGIAPKGRMVMAPTTETETFTKGGEASAGGNIFGADIGCGWKWEKAINREISDATRIIGSIDLKNRNHGNPNAASWTVLENESAKTGVPAHLLTAILLNRHDEEEFQCTFKIKSTVDLTSKLTRLFGSTPADDPVLYDPKVPPTNKLHQSHLATPARVSIGMSASQLDEEPGFFKDPKQKIQTHNEREGGDDNSSESDEDDGEYDDGDEVGARSIQDTAEKKLLAILADIKAGAPNSVVSNELDLSTQGDLDKFMKKNEAYLDKDTHPKKQNLLHLIAEETDKVVLSLIRKMKLLIGALIRLPENLLAKKDAYGKTPVHTALSLRNHRLVRYMCEEHEDINSILRIPTMESRQHMANCLHLAIKNKTSSKDDALLLLLIKKSKVDTLCALDEQGLTPLHLAVAYERCDEAQLKVVQELVTKCDAAVNIMCRLGEKDGFSPYRYHVLTEQQMVRKQATESKTSRPQRKEDQEPKGGPSTNTYRRDDKEPDTSADKSTSQPGVQETRNPVALKPKQADLTAAPTGKYSTASRPSRGPPALATGTDGPNSGSALLTPVGGDKKKMTIRKTKKNADRQIYFDLNGASPRLSEQLITQGLRHLVLEDVLQYVAIPQLNFEEGRVISNGMHGQRPPKPDGSGRTALKLLFKWLRDEKKVNTILRIIVDDLEEPSHSDEAIESCLMDIKGVETWDWRKFDMSPDVIQTAAPDARVIHLYWSGNNAILRAWSEAEGIHRLEKLETVYLHSQQGLESRVRMQQYVAAFKRRISTKKNIQVIESKIRGSVQKNTGNGTDAVEDKYERDRWVTTMERFAEFLQNAERNADPQVTLKYPVTVALIDDGVDINDQTIQCKVIGGRSFCHRDKEENLNQPYYVSRGGHGTAMASYICKICPNVRLYILRLDEYPTESGKRHITAASAEKAVRAAVEKKVDIICMSWTIEKNDNNKQEIAELEYAIAEAAQKDVIMFCAATDQGAYSDRSYPAATRGTKNIFKIGAAEASGTAMKWLGDSRLVDFIFPGHQVVKERSDDPSVKTYTALTGSSVSTALASGLAAVMLYCVQLSAMANSYGRSRPDLSKYESLKNHERMKEAFLNIGTTEESKKKYIAVWERFERPVQNADQQPTDVWIGHIPGPKVIIPTMSSVLKVLQKATVSAGSLALCTCLLKLIIVASYRMLIHPLRGYPGPFVAKLAAWYAGAHAIKRDLHLELAKNHKKYGSVNEHVLKSYTYASTAKDFRVNPLTDRDPKSHSARRRLIGQAITERTMRSFALQMVELVDAHLGFLLASSEAVNMTERMRLLAIDIVGRLAFGYDLGMQKRPKNHFIINAMGMSHYPFNIYHQLYFLSRIEPIRIFNYLQQESQGEYWTLLQTMIKRCMAQDRHAQPDLYSSIAEEMDAQPDTLNGGAMWTEAAFFMAAGGDTVATLMSAAFFYLSRNPECYKTLAHEVRYTFISGREIQAGLQLTGYTYLRACINESLRMSPPSGSVHWGEQDPKDTGPFIVDCHAYFPDPYAFCPDRWLDVPGNREFCKTAHNCLGAFSTGSSSCAGKAMAYSELSLVLAKTIWYFDFDATAGELSKIG
ncbi:putative Peptidase S8/S53 domain-containing protein [Seiridium cardinale]|uniref:Peptidase S8/S53 domain-containing protein n=1 Tax=Seiridium cardinale TaxID=138064 RepID=A0ABR2Y9V3_9PEZI